MDPIPIILVAIEAGSRSPDPAIRLAYNDLKVATLKAFSDDHKAIRALQDFIDDPETYERPLAKAITDAGLDKERTVVDAATVLLNLIEPQDVDVLKQIAEREHMRTSDRFTRMAQGVGDLKRQEEAASHQRMERYWEEEFKRRETVAERQARQKQQERRMLIGVIAIAAIIVVVFLVIIVVSAGG